MALAVQQTFDDLGLPLIDATFCVIDLETTGASPTDCRITEVGAVKLHGGECIGTFQTLVNPGTAIPPNITVLTGITEAMVVPAPPIEEVLPALLEFIGDSVIVGHNIRFDVSFLDAALERHGYPRLAHRTVDTCTLARRIVRDEVPNCKLGTLADRLRLDHRPNHRALDDALATGDLLHALLERVGHLGVRWLDDLLALPTIHGHAESRKLRLTTDLPRSPGVYLFRDAHGRVLYVGKASNLRARVRSYFSTDERRKIRQLLREATAIDHHVCAHPLEAAVREVRLIHEHLPRFNRAATTWQRYAYLKLTLDEPYPRLSVVRAPRPDRALYLGPLASSRAAKRVAEAVESVVPLRRCTARLRLDGAPLRSAPCAPAQLGVATCPCAGDIDAGRYDAIVARAVRGLTTDPGLLLEPLAAQMDRLAGEERFEEAADVRDRAAALARAVRRQRRLDALRRVEVLRVSVPGLGGAELHRGRLVRAWDDARGPTLLPADGADSLLPDPGPPHPVGRDAVDELLAVASWLDANAHRVRLEVVEGELRSELPDLPAFTPGDDRGTSGDPRRRRRSR